MIKFKRYLSIFIILMLACTLLVACGNSDDNNGQFQEENNRQTEEQNNPNPPENNEKHSGEYLGQIDNNSIEIQITEGEGEPQIRAFQLSEEIKENFADYNLKPGEQISFDYETPELGNPIITEIEKKE